MGDIDPKIIKRTQDALGKIIKKPPLTEKLLARPPFRFIHDVCASVGKQFLSKFKKLISSTGLMKGLFTSDELVVDNIKDKEGKLAFLKKIVEFVSVAQNKTFNIKIASIVSGKEPDRTNLLLQSLADIVSKGVSLVLLNSFLDKQCFLCGKSPREKTTRGWCAKNSRKEREEERFW